MVSKLVAPLRAILLLALVATSTSAQTAAARRVAIIIGVSDYGGRGNLSAPAHDARLMTRVLGELGFEVTALADPKPGEVEKAFAAVATTPGTVDQLAVYFSGHGGTIDNQSVLALHGGGAQTIALLPLSTLMTAAARLKPKATLYMLDACRTDEGARLPGGKQGLAPPPRATGSFFAYAAAPGDVAFDDTRRNAVSPFTLALADELLVPNQDIGVVMRKVRERVSKATGGRELPWTEDSLTEPMILNQAPDAPALFALYGRVLKGDVEAERDLGIAYLDGRGVARDVERGLAMLQQAAARKDVPAMLTLGAFEAGRDANTLFPDSKARRWYRMAASAGSAEAWYRLAELDRKALPEGRPPSAATLEAYRQARQGGHRDARARYLALNLSFGFDKALDFPKTIAALRPIAATGNTIAAAAVGEAYSEPGKTQDFKEADFWLAQAVAAGSTEALLSQAKNYGLGRGRPVDEPKAHALTLEAAQRGDARAMLFVGRQLQHGTGVAPDKPAAVDWFRRATEAGDTEAFADLGFAYEGGLGVDRDLRRAVRTYERGAALKDAVSTRYLAVMYENGDGVPLNMDRAISYYQRATDLGDVRAKGSLAVLAINGMLGSVPDLELGAKLLREAVAKSDDADYIFKLAQMTEQGRGMKANPAEAARLYRRAAAFGKPEAFSELATLTLEGKGVAKDPTKAKELYQKAAGAGDAVAYANLAILARGRGEAEEAGRWSRRGAEAGSPETMNMYARDLLLGQEGVAKDTAAAFDWFAKSLARGYPNAADTLQAIVTDRTLDVPDKLRDDAFLVLTKAEAANNPLAGRALMTIFQARTGLDMRRSPLAALERHLDGPQRGVVAYVIGMGYATGRFGNKPDPVKAKTYLEMAAEAGETKAWQALGDLEAGMPGGTPERAFAYYKKGADAGDAGALNDLGIAYTKGLGTPADPAKAFAAFKRSADMDFAPGMYDLALAYKRGMGTPRSDADAAIWFQHAANKGSDNARLALAALLLNRPAADRDYSRAFYNLFRLVADANPPAVKALDEIVRNRELDKPVRARAALLLAIARRTMPKTAAPTLDALVAAHVLRREGAAYGVVE